MVSPPGTGRPCDSARPVRSASCRGGTCRWTAVSGRLATGTPRPLRTGGCSATGRSTSRATTGWGAPRARQPGAAQHRAQSLWAIPAPAGQPNSRPQESGIAGPPPGAARSRRRCGHRRLGLLPQARGGLARASGAAAAENPSAKPRRRVPVTQREQTRLRLWRRGRGSPRRARMRVRPRTAEPRQPRTNSPRTLQRPSRPGGCQVESRPTLRSATRPAATPDRSVAQPDGSRPGQSVVPAPWSRAKREPPAGAYPRRASAR